MFSSGSLFMLALLAVSIIAKNQTLIIAIVALLVVHYAGLGDRVFPFMQAKGITIAVTILTFTVLIPIMTGEIGFSQLGEAVRSFYAWIALAAGIAVAVIAKGGVVLLANDPHITAALVFGTILAVVLFNGIAVGPLIGAGIAYTAMKVVEFFSSSGAG